MTRRSTNGNGPPTPPTAAGALPDDPRRARKPPLPTAAARTAPRRGEPGGRRADRPRPTAAAARTVPAAPATPAPTRRHALAAAAPRNAPRRTPEPSLSPEAIVPTTPTAPTAPTTPTGPPTPTLTRRRALAAAARLLPVAATASAACAGRPTPAPDRQPRPQFSPDFLLPPVKVSRERVIRTVVGLRPFRPSGFRVEPEDLGGGRLLVHNYGHGGGGVTMSWGTAWLAVEELLGDDPPPARAAVLGSGAVGLATARLLQRRGVEVTIYTKDLPPRTTSNVACAQWSPFSVSNARVHTDEFRIRFERAARIAHRIFQDFVGARYGIRWLPNYPLSDVPFGGPTRPQAIADLFPDTRALPPGTHPFPSRHARQFTTMMIEPPIYLNAVLRDFRLAGGRVRIRDFRSLDEVASLPERRVVNCTGIGARDLVGDEELTPLKGQLTVLLPQPEIRYIALNSGLYMMPRADGILLGGTRELGEWSLEPNREAEERILSGHADYFDRMAALARHAAPARA